MPLNKLENFLKNVEGRILYVSPADLDSTDSILNQGNSQTKPFKTLQRALIEAARFSYVVGRNNDIVEKTTILLMPGEHEIDNRPGWRIEKDNDNAPVIKTSDGTTVGDPTVALSLQLESNFDINQENNILYKFNSIHGGVVVPRGTSIVGLDLRKTKIRPKYVPNPTDDTIPNSALFRITGACYFWQFSIFDGNDFGKVYINNQNFTDTLNQVQPTFSHHKLTCFEYADGVNEVDSTGITDLDMYYYKLTRAFNNASNRDIEEKYPASTDGFAKQRPEWEIVGAFLSDPLTITNIKSGDISGEPTNKITVTTQGAHNLNVGTPIKINGVGTQAYNISTKVASISDARNDVFTYTLPFVDKELKTNPTVDGATVTIETDTVSGASPYIFNVSLRSVWGMNGMHADGSKASGFRSMVVAQFTGVSLQKDDRAFVKYNTNTRGYDGIEDYENTTGTALASESSSTNPTKVYHLDSNAVYRDDWQTTHVKITNDAILQIVSVFAIGYTNHFKAESGGDASITNSNSNFGQLALVSDGFKKDAFTKDDHGYITHIITPKAIVEEEEDIEWLQIDASITTNVNIPSNLYLFGYNSESIKPPSLTQGFRIGARNEDKLYLNYNNITYEADIVMSDGSTSGKKVVGITQVNNSTFTSSNHGLETGEKVIINSDDGDLPENIDEHKVFFVNYVSANSFRLSATKSDADNGVFINCFGGSNLVVYSRVTDKESGDIGHPVQYDDGNSNWYIKTKASSGIFNVLNNNNETGSTDITFFKRKIDTRSLDDKIFKVRVSVPKESSRAKDVQNGFILQESSQTGIRTDGDFNISRTLNASDFAYNRNPRFISNCTFNSGTVTIETERPHNLTTGDLVKIEAIRSTNNSNGTFNKDYNIETSVTVTGNMQFTYSIASSVGNPTNDFNLDKTTVSIASSIPKFTRKDLQSNLYFYRNNVISQYNENVRTGVYHGFPLFADLSVPTGFTSNEYGQNVVDLYPQLDRDNQNDTPRAAKSFAARFPLGKVVTNDLQKSITREATDKLFESFGVGFRVSEVAADIITFDRNHNIGGIASFVVHGSTSGFSTGTYENVKVTTNSNNTVWTGALAKVEIDNGQEIQSVKITNPGSGFNNTNKGYLDKNVIGEGTNGIIGSDASGTAFADANLTSSKENLVVQFTGSGITTDSYYRTTSVPGTNKISIAKTSGDPDITTNQYAFIVGNALDVTTSDSSGTVTVTTSNPHDLKKGNRFQFNDDSNNNLGTFIVSNVVSITSFAFNRGNVTIPGAGYVLKHGLSANEGIDTDGEDLSSRGVQLFGLETAKLQSTIASSASSLTITLLNSQEGIPGRFPLGCYIQIDEEIIRVAKEPLTNGNTEILRGLFGTVAASHAANSRINKISPIPIELHRPSILRASGHTFEYLGYGPGNYSTALPQVQIKTLTEREEFLSQAQERAAGAVVYTGMNDKGDFYIGNQKKSSLTGEETTFDNPVPTVAGEDPSRLSVVFDEVTIKDRLVVEGGANKNLLSQFDGPVTFSKEVNVKEKLRVKSDAESLNSASGALRVDGGVGIGGKLNVGGNTDINTQLTANTVKVETLTATRVPFVGTGSTLTDDSNLTYDGTDDTGGLSITNTTNTISTTTGALKVSGGVGIVKSVYIGGDIHIPDGKNTFFGTDDDLLITHDGSNAAITNGTGNLNITGATTFANAVTVTSGGIDVTAGGIDVTAGGADITGIITARSGLTVSAGGATINGIITANDGLKGNILSPNGDTYVLTNGTGDGTNSTFTGTASKANAVKVDSASTLGNALYFMPLIHMDRSFTPPDGVAGEATSGTHFEQYEQMYVDEAAYFLNSSSGNEFNIKGDIVAFAAQASDDRLKTNRSPISDALNKVNSINGFTYNWNNKAKELLDMNTTELQIGVSAQEVQSVVPEVIKTRKVPKSDEEILIVKYEKLIPLLIEAIKELSDKVDSLEERLNN